MKKYLFILIFFAGCVMTVNAQSINEFQIGLAMPQGDFADDDEDDAIFDGSGIAATGVYVGYKLLTPLNSDGLFWTFTGGIMYNDLQRDFKDDMDDEADDIILPKYLNLHLLAGLHYEQLLSEGLKLYGEAGLGLNILKLTNLTATYLDYETEIEEIVTFKPSTGLAFKIGGGIVLQDKYTISLNYLSLGSHKVKYDYEYEYYGETERDDDKFDRALSVSSLNITFGIRF